LRTGSGLGPTRRVARWFVFKPKIKILQGLAMDDVAIFYDHFGLFYGHWKYFMAIWNILWSFGIFFPVLVCCTKKNLATLPTRP
jgi:hypothetical protein